MDSNHRPRDRCCYFTNYSPPLYQLSYREVTTFIRTQHGGLAQSVECVVRNDEAPGSKPGFSTFCRARNDCMSERHWCSGNIGASQALAPGSIPGWRTILVCVYPDGSVQHVVEMTYLLGLLAQIKCSICS